jgi:hypothetical protein
MNACPHCQQTYEDWVEFCFEDGTPLVARNGHRAVVADPAHADSTVPNGPLPGRASAAAARSLVAFEDDADEDPTVPAVHPAHVLGGIDTEEVSLSDAPTVELPNPPADRRPAHLDTHRPAAPSVAGPSPVTPPRRAAPQVSRSPAAPERPATAATPPVSAPHPPVTPPPSAQQAAGQGAAWTRASTLWVVGSSVLVLAGVMAWAWSPEPHDGSNADAPPAPQAAAGDAAAVLAGPSGPAAPAPSEDAGDAEPGAPRKSPRREAAGPRNDRRGGAEGSGAPLAAEVGNLIITSRPDGASVTVDGEDAGTTPLQYDVPYGSHTIRLRLDGYKPETRDVSIHTRKLPLPFTLQPTMRTGVVRLSAPGAARVLVDGSDVGVLPARLTLNEGSHEFQVVGVDPRGSCTKRMDVSLGGTGDVALVVRCP